MTPSVFGTHMRKRAFTAIAAAALAGLALPASSLAAIAEVGAIENTTPATVPSCTAGSIGSFGKHLEEEKKLAEKQQVEAEQKKTQKKKAKKSTASHRAARRGHTSSARKASMPRWHAHVAAHPRGSARNLLLSDGGLAAPLLSKARIATSSTTSTTSTTSQEPGSTTEGSEVKPKEATEAPCLAVSRTTGFQVKVGKVNSPLVIPANGRIVAWTINLGKPTASQVKFFDENEGGAASAGIAVLYPMKKPKLTYHLLAQSPIVKLEPFFGMNVQLPLEQTIKVKKGDIVALTVPTWAPSLALGFGKNTAWRASRQSSQCSTTNSQTAQTELKSNLLYACSYQTARLTYSATLISTP